MKNYKQQIKEYKEEIEEKYVRAEAENKTVKACQNIFVRVGFYRNNRIEHLILNFLYEQGQKFIKKKMVDFTRLCSYVSMDMVE